MLNGIDLSNWQGSAVDWDAIAAAGYSFAVIKASEGVTFTDPDFARNWSECKRVGMLRFAYHFARLSQNAAADEWNYHKSIIDANGGYQPGDGDMLDLEDTAVAAGADLSPWTLAYLQSNQLFRMLLYSGDWYLQPHGLENNAQVAAYPLMYASWQAARPPAPPAWPQIAIWQNAAGVNVPGANNVDTDIFYGDRAALAALGLQAAKPPLDCAARLQLTGYVAGGSGVADLVAWLGGYQ